MLDTIMLHISQVDIYSWLTICVLLLLCIFLYIKRATPAIQSIVDNIVTEIEDSCNSDNGQRNLDSVANVVRPRLPFIFRIFMTKRTLVTIIETSLNKVSATFELNRIVDIKGNDDVLPTKLNIEVNSVKDIPDGQNALETDNSDSEVYASVKTQTNWKDDTNTSVEVGFKKKF